VGDWRRPGRPGPLAAVTLIAVWVAMIVVSWLLVGGLAWLGWQLVELVAEAIS
jgi:hypothetical protein